jgi:glycosyltransferase involved in cell wall biosynthesis
MLSPNILTICFPVHNGQKYIGKALHNTINQLLKFKIPAQILVSNNASTDETLRICKKYKKKFKYFKIFNRKKKITLNQNHNYLLKKVSTNFFVFHSHDDLRLKNFYKKCIDLLQKNPEAVLAYTYANYFDEESKKIYRKEKCKKMGQGMSLNSRFINSIKNLETCAFHGVYRTETVKNSNIFLEDYLGSDHTFLNQLSCIGNFIEVKKYLMLMHEPKSKWIDGSVEKKIKINKVQKTFFPFSKVFFKSIIFAFSKQRNIFINIFLLIKCLPIYLKNYFILDLSFHKKKFYMHHE